MQPRRTFDDAAIASLAESIRQRGTLQPILVRPAEGGFELIAGERRLRAAQLAGVHELPAIVRAARDEELLELALIENIQREDLNPVERARAYQSLAEKYRLSHEDIAKKTGEDRATVTNYVRLLSLCDQVLELLANGAVSTGHAKALAGITDYSLQFNLATKAASGKWSVRQVEAAVAKAKSPGVITRPAESRPTVKDLEVRLAASLGMRVRIKEGRKRHSGRVIIDYYNLDDFERITARLGVSGAGS
jgi:ParB family chromosome partitioning protein